MEKETTQNKNKVQTLEKRMYSQIMIIEANIYRCSLGDEYYYHRGEYNPEIVSFIHHIKGYYSEWVSTNFVEKDKVQI